MLMNRFLFRSIGAALGLSGLLTAQAAAADDSPPLTTPSLDTGNKPLNEAAPTGATPKLVGVSAFGGVMLVDLGPLNDRLASNGYAAKLPLVFPILGGQGFGLFGHFLIGGSGAGLLARNVDGPNGTSKVSASGAWGTFDFGYQLLRVNGFLVAPVLSLGGYGMDVTIDDKAGDSFDHTLGNPHRGANLTNNGFLGGISLVAKTILIGRNAHVADARSGWSLGLRVGGLYGIPTHGWRSNGADISGGPSFGLRGGYAALSIGAGTW
jgi:hypothetical protein